MRSKDKSGAIYGLGRPVLGDFVKLFHRGYKGHISSGVVAYYINILSKKHKPIYESYLRLKMSAESFNDQRA